MPRVVVSENGGSDYWITVVTLPSVDKALSSSLSKENVDALITQLAMDPEMGTIVPNSGGLRKVRFPCKNAGKSGGLRVIYMYRDLNMPLYLIAAYEKTKKSRYTERELSAMRSLCTQIVNEHAAQNIRKINGSWSA